MVILALLEEPVEAPLFLRVRGFLPSKCHLLRVNRPDRNAVCVCLGTCGCVHSYIILLYRCGGQVLHSGKNNIYSRETGVPAENFLVACSEDLLT